MAKMIFILFFISLLFLLAAPMPSMAKVTHISTSCEFISGMQEHCESLFSITDDIGKSSSFIDIKEQKFNVDIDSSIYDKGQFLIHEGIVKAADVEITKEGLIKVSGDIMPGTQNLWGFSILGDESHLHSVWWSSSFPYRYNISCENVDDNVTILVNSTSGVNINGSVEKIWTYCTGNNPAVYFFNYTNYVIADDIGQLPFEVISGNGTSFNPSGVWGDNAIAVWQCSENTGTAARDSADKSSSFNGTLSNSAAWTSGGRVGSSCYPNDAYMMSQADVFDSGLGNGTLMFWFKPDVNYDAARSADDEFFWNMLRPAVVDFQARWENSITDIRYYFSGASYDDSTGLEMSAGTWYLLTFTWGNGSMTMYVDDTLETAFASSEGPADSSDNGFSIGDNIAGSNAVDGAIDEIRLFNTAWDSEYVSQVYNNMIGTAGYGMTGNIDEYNFSTPGGEKLTIAAVYNEDNESAIQNYNITVIFLSTGMTYDFEGSGSEVIPFSNITTGNAIVRIKSDGYYMREYSTTISASNVTIIAYLLPESLGSVKYIPLTVTDVNAVGLQNAYVNMSRNIGGDFMTVSGVNTDAVGAAYFYLDSDVIYRVTLSKSGYSSLTVSQQFQDTTGYSYILNASMSINYTNVWDGLKWNIRPFVSSLNNNTLQNFTFYLDSAGENITQQSINVTWNGTETLYFGSDFSSPYGTTLNYTLNLSGYTGNIIVYGLFNKTGYEQISVIKIFTITKIEPQGYTLQDAIEAIISGEYGIDKNVGSILIIFAIMMLVSSLGFMIGGMNGASIVGLIFMFVLVYLGVIPVYLFALVCITVFIYIFLGARQ